MKLGLSTSRLAAVPAIGLLSFTLQILLLWPSFVLGVEFGAASEFFLHERLHDDELVSENRHDSTYDPSFAAFGRDIIGRAPPGVTGLLNNIRENRNVRFGSTQQFAFEATRIFSPERLRDMDGGGDGSRTRRGLDVGNETMVHDLDISDEDGPLKEGNDAKVRRRQQRTPKTVYISATTCLHPERRSNNTSIDPPQLTLFLSTTDDNQTPGPGEDSSQQISQAFEEGAVMLSVNATGDVFFGISASSNSNGMFDGEWNFDVAVSTDSFYHTVDETPGGVFWVDSDSTAALLITPDLIDTHDAARIQQIMDDGPQYTMFVENEDGSATKGVRHSHCGLSNYAQMSVKAGGRFGENATTVMTTRWPGGLPKQQFHFNGLNSSASYLGFLVHTGPESLKRQTPNRIGGGGQVFRATQFETKEGDNCKIITDLEFCNETGYAVPANDENFDTPALARFYDNFARDMYQFFERQLAQVACEAPPTQRYSLTRNCTDCEIAYKKWLCSVTIPRCEDFTGDNPFSLVRNVNQSFPNGTRLSNDDLARFRGSKHLTSRMARIDQEVAPGPYREILPCEDLCYDLVRNCPASLEFACPRPNQDVFNSSYQVRGEGVLTCNYPGSVHNPSGAMALAISTSLLFSLVITVLSAVVLL